MPAEDSDYDYFYDLVDRLLEVYSVDDILESNDMDIVDALVVLAAEGYIVLPEEARPV